MRLALPRPAGAVAPALLRRHAWLIVVLVVAAGVRVAALLHTPGYVPFGDPADYDRIATSLSVLGEYPPTQYAVPGSATAFRGPAYPYLLSWVYEVTGGRYGAARGLSVVLGTASVALVWAVAARVWDRRVAIVAAAICALLPSLVWLSGGLVAENLFVPLVLAALLATVLHRDRPRIAYAAAAGALCAAAALTRNNGLVVLVPLLLGLWTARRGWRDPAVALAAAAIVLTPWALRNHHAFGVISPLGTSSGYTSSGAWNPESAKGGDLFAASRNPPDVPAWADLFRPPRFDEAQLDGKLRKRAFDYAWDHPGFVLRATGVHVLRQFLVGPGQARQADLSAQELGIPSGDRWALRPPVLVLVALAVAGVVLVARRRIRGGPWWLWLVPAAVLVSSVPFVGGPRYRIPVDPFLAMLAAAVLVFAFDAARRRPAGGGAQGEGDDGAPAAGAAGAAAA